MIAGGPDIVTDKLKFYVDTKNTKSYSGDVSIWYDLDGSSNGSFGPVTSFQNNSIYFNATSNAVIQFTDNVFFNTSLPFTIEFWSKLSYPYTGSYPVALHIKTTQATGLIFFYGSGDYNGLNFGSNLNFTRLKCSTTSFFHNTWVQHVMVFDGVNITLASSYKLYLNAMEQNLTGANSFSEVPNTNVFGGAYNVSGAYFTGYIDNVKTYTKALTHKEIFYNFSNLKSRYNL